MRKVVFFVILCIGLSLHAQKESAVRRMVQLLTEMEKREEITPDSFFTDVRQLRQVISAEQDSTGKAIYRAVLAHLLAVNKGRSQASVRQTPSHPDSIQEWSREEYLQHAASLYRQSMRDLELLHNARTRDWLPLVRQGRDEAVFGSSMLHVVWNALNSDFDMTRRKTESFLSYAAMADFYRLHGMREAALRTLLDSLSSMGGGYTESRVEIYEKLRREYADIPACALVYLHIARLQNFYTDDSRMAFRNEALLMEALQRYPNAPCRAEIENMLAELREPHLVLHLMNAYYPASSAILRPIVRNMESISLQLYLLPEQFKVNEELNLLTQVKRQGKLIETKHRTFPAHPRVERWEDSIMWKTPSRCGRYALVMDGKPGMTVSKKEPCVQLFSVSRLSFFMLDLPDDQLRLVAVDAQTGEPQSGVTVNFYRREGQKDVLQYQRTTGKRGRVDIALPSSQRGQFFVHLSRAEDKYLEKESYYHYLNRNSLERDSVSKLSIFTDRSIYRPGQVIHVAALSYKEKGWDARVAEGKPYTLTFFDANNQNVLQHELKTDAFGMLSDSLQIPEKGLPGSYKIRLGGTFHWVQVEEYRRPTFYVEMESEGYTPNSASSDSLRIKGLAVTYSGVPVSNARVTGSYSFQRSRWCWPPVVDSGDYGTTDTLWTDSEGRFEIPVPIKGTEEQLKSGRLLRLNVDVLSPQGETQQGVISQPVCSTPLRLVASIPAKQDKERLKPWRMDLYDAAENPVTAEVKCEIRGATFKLRSGESIVPEELASLPSGVYPVKAMAVVEGDTARWEGQFTLFSMLDTRLAEEHPLLLYCPCDTFDTERPAEVRIGTSLPDAWIHAWITSKAGLTLDTLLHVSDTAFVWTIPYRTTYGQGSTLQCALFHEGQFETAGCVLHLRQPDVALRPHWDTFRDRVRPGDREEWRLSLRKPDGSPAQANVLLSLYDKSLDAISPHSLRMGRYRPYLITDAHPHPSGAFGFGSRLWLPISLHYQKVRDFETSSFNHKYFSGAMAMEERMVFATAGEKRVLREVQSPVYKASRSVNTVAMADAAAPQAVMEEAADKEYAVQESNAKAAGLVLKGYEDDEELAEEEPLATASLRTNLSELAFFFPQLRTNAAGEATIVFTLPDALTSWHLTGFAHTQDLMLANLDETLVAQKELMAELHLPRFLRSGDEGVLTASIRNISDDIQKGTATWQILDAETERVLRSGSSPFSLAAHSDTTITFSCRATADHPMLSVRWIAKTAESSDGEERPLPVLSNMQSITETKAFSIKGPQRWKMDLKKLFQYDDAKATGRSLTVEYTARPMWLALQSLPTLMSPVHRDVLSLTSTFYAGSLASYIAQRVPTMPAALRQWAEEGLMESPLQRNQELADMLLQETPWVMEASRERTRRQNLLTLFEEESQQDRRMMILSAMRVLQQPDGSFAWYPGMKGSPYLTREVAYLLTRLQVMTAGAEPDAASLGARELLSSAVRYLEDVTSREVKEMKKVKNPSVGLSAMRYLYIIYRSGWNLQGSALDDARYLVSLLRKEADEFSGESRALAAIVLQLAGEEKQARSLMNKFHTLLQHSDGTYLAYPGGSFTSIDRKLQIHVQVMEALQMVEPEQADLLIGMQEWLLQQKRTQEWEQPAQTANAVYALMQGETQWQTDASIDVLLLQDGRKTVTLTSPESSLGYVRTRVEDVRSPKELSVQKTSPDISWGAVYAQYQIPSTEVEAQQEGLNIRRDLSKETIRVGDRIHLRYTITADRDYEFVRLAAPRAAAAEPASQISGYRWQNGIGYYCALHDASTEYFIDHLPRGTYVIEEDWLVARSGSFGLPPVTLQCLYAPEFQAHTSGMTLTINP